MTNSKQLSILTFPKFSSDCGDRVLVLTGAVVCRGYAVQMSGMYSLTAVISLSTWIDVDLFFLDSTDTLY